VKYRALIIVLILAHFLSCTKSDDSSLDYKYEYYPVSLGYWIEYAVDSMRHTKNNPTTHDTFHYFIKEIISDSFIDLSGGMSWEITQYKRYKASATWVFYQKGTLRKNKTELIKTFSNDAYLKLVFPIAKSYSWNGYRYNSLNAVTPSKDSSYTYITTDLTEKIGSFTLDSVTTVEHYRYEEDVLEKFLSEDKFAKNIGLVYNHELHFEKQPVKDWKDVQAGYEIIYTLYNYKK
jgi:hypothetical protein